MVCVTSKFIKAGAIAVGYGLDYLDKHTHAAAHVASWFRSMGESLKSAAQYLTDMMPKNYDGYPEIYTMP